MVLKAGEVECATTQSFLAVGGTHVGQLSADEGYHGRDIAAASPEPDVDVRAGNSYSFPLTKHSLGIGAAEFAD